MMKGKLIKRGEGDYKLFVNDTPFGQSKESPYNKLSLKNCEAIANGYDLDELTNRAFDNMGYHSTVTPHEEKQFKLGYRVAFREALEILGDKKFSEEDVKKRVELVKEQFRKDVDAYGKPKKIMSTLDTIHQSLQQTEWDVFIEMECPQCKEYGYISECRNVCNKKFIQPKLDTENCLILKRKI